MADHAIRNSEGEVTNKQYTPRIDAQDYILLRNEWKRLQGLGMTGINISILAGVAIRKYYDNTDELNDYMLLRHEIDKSDKAEAIYRMLANPKFLRALVEFLEWFLPLTEQLRFLVVLSKNEGWSFKSLREEYVKSKFEEH